MSVFDKDPGPGRLMKSFAVCLSVVLGVCSLGLMGVAFMARNFGSLLHHAAYVAQAGVLLYFVHSNDRLRAALDIERKLRSEDTTAKPASRPVPITETAPHRGPDDDNDRRPGISVSMLSEDRFDNIVEQAYKDKYVDLKNNLTWQVTALKQSDVTDQQFAEMALASKEQYRRAICRQVADATHWSSAIHGGMPGQNSASSTLVRVNAGATLSGHALDYAILFHHATHKFCSADKAERHQERFNMYFRAALEHATEKSGQTSV